MTDVEREKVKRDLDHLISVTKGEAKKRFKKQRQELEDEKSR
jgi:hypothetical protein